MEAVKAMKEGKKVTRPTFNEDNYLYLDGGIIKCKLTKENAYFHYKSIQANDWEIVEEKKTLGDKIYNYSELHKWIETSEEDYSKNVKLKVILRIEDVKEAIEKLFDIAGYPMSFNDWKKRAKEIFGERFI